MLLGTCGWSYQEWVGHFYPNNRVAKLPFYAKVFETVEVDSSFYRMPTKSMVKGWEKATGPTFKFSLKLPKAITHDKNLVDAQGELQTFLDVIKPLHDADKLACILIQLGPSFSYEKVADLESFLGMLPDDLQFAIEFRNESWDRDETWDLLRGYNVASTITDSPIEFLSNPVITAKHVYIRWHGRGTKIWYDYNYSKKQLASWAQKIKETLSSKDLVAYAYFNNHYRAKAPINALQLLEMMDIITESQEKVLKLIGKRAKRDTKITDYANYGLQQDTNFKTHHIE